MSAQRGLRPCDPGIYRFLARMVERCRSGVAAPAIPAPESALRSHPCVAVPSARVFSEWSNAILAGNGFPSNGDHPLNFVSHRRGSVQTYTCERITWCGGNGS
jgi:hypothetical protein